MKKTKKTLVTALSFILFIAIMMTTTIIPVSADESAPVTIHYYNENSFTSPYLYYYTDSYNPVIWPGVAMTNDGDGWYSYTVNDYAEIRVIFSDNGSNQNPAQNQPGYLVSGEKWYKNGSFYSTDPDLARLKIHYYNYNAWNSPYVYYYTDGSNPVTWPGAAMTADGDGWYTYEIIGYESARVIFSNNGNNQIPAQNQPGYLREEESWYRNGTWTTSRPDDITVYFYKPSNWSAPNIYYYLNNNDTGPAWPGTAMDEISEGWYSYNITKYDSAKVLFNDGTNQIPAQNQPGLDAEGIMWYKNGVWCDSETDTDEDELPDYMELVLGTNINGTDSDSDGLPDGYEVLTLGTDPTLADSDSNNVSDAAEDADSDGLTNLSEYQLGTDPTVEDSDGDGLDDGDEVTTYLTDPTDEDTDSDGASDGWEITHNADPLIADVSFNVTVSLGFRDDDVAPSVSAVLPGEQAESLAIKQVTDNEYFINETAGIIGNAYDFTTNGTISSAEISFEFDSDLLLDPDFDPVIYWFDEENQVLEPVATTVTNNTATAQVTHFSLYMLIDDREYLDEFDWVEEYTLYKDYDEMELVFVIDNSSSMLISDPNNSRESIAASIANAFPNNTDTSAYVLANNSIIGLADQDGPFKWQSQNTQYALPVITYHTGGELNSIFRGILCSYDIFDSDTTNHKILRHIVVLTDGNSIDHTLDNQFGDPNLQYDIYNEIASCQSTKECQISIIDFSQSGTDTMSATADLSAVIPVHYYLNCNYQLFMNEYYKILDLGLDSDGDGIPDDYEDDIMLYNGQTISTNYLLSDTDGDGLKDGEEVRLEVKYSPDGNYATVVGHLVSDPTDEDGDKDGDLDSIDPNPLDYQLNGYFISQLKELYRLAEEYPHLPDAAGLFYTNIEDWLTFMFIRSFQLNENGSRRYDDLRWIVTAGDIDDRFIEYVRINNPSLYHYFETTSNIYANSHEGLSPETWEKIDLYHMAGTISALIYLSDREIDISGDLAKFAIGFMTSHLVNPVFSYCGIDVMKYIIKNKLQSEKFVDNILGWAGDVRSLMNDVIEYKNNPYNIESFDGFYCSFVDLFGQDGCSFSYEDLYGDIDSYNIFSFNGTDTMVSRLDEYYGNRINMVYRFHTFVNGKTIQEFNEFVEPYTKNYYIDNRLSIIIKHYCTDEQIEAAKYAFSAIIFNLMNSEEL